ncbi:MAG: hypothetical protein ABFS56_05430 [Pseudomonadota bacterium]
MLSGAIVSLSNERLLHKILPYFFVVIFITTAVGALSGYLEHNSWKIGDWLVNYQGGIVRRGLLGELIYNLSQFTHINPGILVFLFQTLFYAVFFVFSYSLLKRQHSLLPYALLIFSPFIFTFQINDLQGGYRKEIIYFAVLAFIVWSAKTSEHKIFEKIFYTTLLLYPAIILTHEMLAVFLPYLLIVYISVTNLTKNKIITIALFLLPSIVSFFVSIYYSGTTSQVTEIFNSIAREGYTIVGGAIESIDKSATYGYGRVIKSIDEKHYLIYYLQVLLFSLIAYIPIGQNLRLVFKQKLSIVLVLISILGTTVLFVVAIDWGRFIYIHLVSLFLLSFISTRLISSDVKRINEEVSSGKKLITYKMLVFFIFYSLFWHIRHSGSPIQDALSYKRTNVVAFAKPYKKTLLLLWDFGLQNTSKK